MSAGCAHVETAISGPNRKCSRRSLNSSDSTLCKEASGALLPAGVQLFAASEQECAVRQLLAGCARVALFMIPRDDAHTRFSSVYCLSPTQTTENRRKFVVGVMEQSLHVACYSANFGSKKSGTTPLLSCARKQEVTENALTKLLWCDYRSTNPASNRESKRQACDRCALVRATSRR